MLALLTLRLLRILSDFLTKQPREARGFAQTILYSPWTLGSASQK